MYVMVSILQPGILTFSCIVVSFPYFRVYITELKKEKSTALHKKVERNSNKIIVRHCIWKLHKICVWSWRVVHECAQGRNPFKFAKRKFCKDVHRHVHVCVHIYTPSINTWGDWYSNFRVINLAWILIGVSKIQKGCYCALK